MTTRYVYDGWRLVAELNGNTVLRSYAWGKDLSGSLDGAGGGGGLVAQTDHTTEAVYFPAYDGNGNVTALVKGTGQSVSAWYGLTPARFSQGGCPKVACSKASGAEMRINA